MNGIVSTYRLIDLATPVNLSHPLNKNLVAWWKILPQYGMGGTVLRELVRNRYPGTLTGMSATRSATSGWDVSERLGSYGELNGDGTDDYVTTGQQADFNLTGSSFTLAFWAKTTSTTATITPFIVRQNNNTTANILGGIIWNHTSTGKCVFDTWDYVANRVLSNFSTINEGAWHHCVGTYAASGGLASLYIDGKFDNSATQVGSTSSTSKGFTFGANGAASFVQFFPGAFDDARLYNRALSAAEVLALYQESSNPASALLRYIPRTRRAPSAFAPPPYHRPLRVWRAA